MMQRSGRYPAVHSVRVADGWRLRRLTPASRLYGANGIRAGADDRLYVAQVLGSCITAIDPDSGAMDTISPQGGAIVAPDDLAFSPRGELYATEVLDGRVAVLGVDGHARVLRDDLPAANGITFHHGRLFIDECRIGGRVLELPLDGGEPRLILDNVPLPNALEVGPGGHLYFPVMGTNEIWRVHPDGGPMQRVVGDLAAPVAVKFDPYGYIVSPQSATGEVLRIHPGTGERSTLARLDPGLDNLTFLGDRLFVSHLSNGQVTEILGGAKDRLVLPGGFNGPMGLAVGGDGRLYIADGVSFYVLPDGGAPQRLGMIFSPGYPGNVRGLAADGDGFVTTTTTGRIVRYRPQADESEMLAEGFDQLYGLAMLPDGAVVAAERGAGRLVCVKRDAVEVLAEGLSDPTDVVLAPDGALLVSEAGAGRVSRVTGAGTEILLDGLCRPQGLAIHGGRLFIVDAGTWELLVFDLATGQREVIAAGLPLGAPPGVTPKPLRAMLPFSGPMGPFAAIAVGGDGTLYLSADGEGSVMALRHRRHEF